MCRCGYKHPRPSVRSVFLATSPDVLHEIIVVDDAADPPIAPSIPDARGQKVRDAQRRGETLPIALVAVGRLHGVRLSPPRSGEASVS